MGFKLFDKLFPKKFLGIDIGVHSIKVVEISKWGGGRTLENYGLIESKSLFKEEMKAFDKTTLMVSTSYVSRAIKAVIQEAKIKEKASLFSIPDFSTFFVSFELPPMIEKEIKEAVRYTAPQYIPLPLSEVTLDWKLIEGRPSLPREKGTKLKVLAVAIPNEIVSHYRMVADLTKLELYALESEVFGLTKSCVQEKDKMLCLIDLGAHTTTVNIVDKGRLKESHSLDLSGNELTYVLSKSLNIEYHQAEKMKKEIGLMPDEENIAETLYPFIDLFLNKVKNIFHSFSGSDGKTIDKILLAGGGANLPGLKTYVEEFLKIETEIPNPFRNLLYPSDLEQTLDELGPIFANAIGAALIGLEQI